MRTLLFFILLFSSTFVGAQNNYKEAYIITLENDTIYGYANFRSDLLNLSECLFKTNIDETPTTYHPADIVGYGFKTEDKLYVQDSIMIKGAKQLVFLEYLVRGISASLFYYEYAFYDKNNELGQTEQLFVIKDIYGDMHTIEKKPDEYINTLSFRKDVTFRKAIYKVLNYNSSMINILDKTTFTRNSMSDAIKKYNDLTCGTEEESCIVYRTEPKEYIKFKYALYAGGRYIDLPNTIYSVKSSPIGYIIGAQLILTHPRTSDALSFVTDVSFSQLKKNLLDNEKDHYYDSSALALDVNIGLRYTYPKGKIRPGFGLGLGRLYLFNQKIETNNPRNKYKKWLEDAYTEAFGSLSVDYLLRNKKFIFLQFNIDSELESFISVGGYTRDKYTISARFGYKF